ncbi:50S ribosomal protein L22 [Candidatus Woesearchaeota archaeon B3_Woes]|nr:MAG: 50S ribosomal protein L22 [Candidatus Woesearchaeota archaeon B3_Woes]
MIVKEYNKETMARTVGRALPISTRHAIEISNYIRGKNVQKMKTFLEGVIKKEKVVPFTRFNKGVGHKKGMGPGRYPLKASTEILSLLKSAEANAQFKALNTANLIIGHINANQGSNTWHYGRQRRRKMKRTNMDIILVEKTQEKRKPSEEKPKIEIKKEDNKKVEEGKKKND